MKWDMELTGMILVIFGVSSCDLDKEESGFI